ncbi:MAG TPA: hypothetical protein VFE54_12035, partial [Mucilaginibacter sp.]|nr:hypothetical protein [Mucilaginibacter sp.]
MKKTVLIAIFSFVAQLSMGQAHDKRFNFDYITYAFGGEYQENVATDNVHMTGYLNIGFSQFVYFPNNVYTDAYAVNQFNYISAETKPR